MLRSTTLSPKTTKSTRRLYTRRLTRMMENPGISFPLQLDPLNSDCDNDGIPDGKEEKALNGWPTSPIYSDTDGDGIDDPTEIANGLSPISRDTDQDTYPDNTDIAPLGNAIVRISGTMVNTFSKEPTEAKMFLISNGTSYTIDLLQSGAWVRYIDIPDNATQVEIGGFLIIAVSYTHLTLPTTERV